jgi:dTDP-4-dehydrorhamnose reductase
MEDILMYYYIAPEGRTALMIASDDLVIEHDTCSRRYHFTTNGSTGWFDLTEVLFTIMSVKMSMGFEHPPAHPIKPRATAGLLIARYVNLSTAGRTAWL